MMKKIKVFSALLSLSLFFPFVACGGDGTVRVVFTDWEPYGYMDNGKAAGFELETFAAVMKKMGMETEFLPRPWKRCLLMAKNGSGDVIISVVRTPEREGFLHYPREPISLSNSAFFTLVGKDISFGGSYEELKGRPIGVTSGFSYGEAFDSADFLKKDEASDTESVIRKLVAGRYDIAVGNTVVISSIAQKMGVRSRIRFLTPLVHSEKVYSGFSKAGRHGKLVDDFSKALAGFKTSSEYKEILARYGVSVHGEK